MGELCNAEEAVQLGGSLAVGDRAAWEGAMQWRAVQQGAVQHGGSCATGSHATRRREMGSCASGRCATGGRHAMGRRATGRCAMGRRATGGSHAMWSHATGRRAMGRHATGGSCATGSRATGRRATGRRATGCHAARLAQGWRVQVPSWPGSAQGWAPVLVSAPRPAAPRWAAGRRPRGGNTPEGGGWGVTPAAPLHASPRTAGKTRLQQRSGLREGDGAGTRAAGEGPEKGRHAAACAAQGPRASVRGAAPLPVPQPGRQHPVTGNVAGLCGESCAIPPRRHTCARHPWVPPAACHVLPATCRERVWLSPRPAPRRILHVRRCCRGERKSAAGPAKNNKPGWVSAQHRGGRCCPAVPCRGPLPAPTKPPSELCAGLAGRCWMWPRGWSGRRTWCCCRQGAPAWPPCATVVAFACPWGCLCVRPPPQEVLWVQAPQSGGLGPFLSLAETQLIPGRAAAPRHHGCPP